jgi:hypothetical protein
LFVPCCVHTYHTKLERPGKDKHCSLIFKNSYITVVKVIITPGPVQGGIHNITYKLLEIISWAWVALATKVKIEKPRLLLS